MKTEQEAREDMEKKRLEIERRVTIKVQERLKVRQLEQKGRHLFFTDSVQPDVSELPKQPHGYEQ